MSSLAKECKAALAKSVTVMSHADVSLLLLMEADLARIVPRAIEMLAVNPFIEAEHYRGDLLKNTLRVPANYWAEHQDQWLKMHSILHDIEEIVAEIAEAKFAFFQLK